MKGFLLPTHTEEEENQDMPKATVMPTSSRFTEHRKPREQDKVEVQEPGVGWGWVSVHVRKCSLDHRCWLARNVVLAGNSEDPM